MNKYFSALIASIIIAGCTDGCCSWDYKEEDFEFNAVELSFMDAYATGDTLYFESNTGDVDTITILEISEERQERRSCFISRAPSHHKSIMMKHLPTDTWAGTTLLENGEKRINYQSLISIAKRPLELSTKYRIIFKDFTAFLNSGFIDFQKESTINEKVISDCYIIPHSYPERIENPTDVELVYWTVKHGLTAYKDKSGETWLLKKIE